jgi:uncharacterized membrane protein YhaH (DUF805 family)
MLDRYRFYATVAVWTAFTLIIIAMTIALAVSGAPMTEESLTIPLLIFVMFLTLMAGYSTARIWRDATASGTGRAEDGQQVYKTKRGDQRRIARLLEGMDDDEIVELETLLLAHEEEALRRDG